MPFSSGLFSDPALVFNDGVKYLHLGPHLEYLEDPTRKMGFSKIRDKPHVWISTRSGKKPYGFAGSAYWIRFRINTGSLADRKWVLIHGLPRLHHLDFYRPNSENGYEKLEAGALRAFSTREIPYRHFAFYMQSTSAPARDEAYYYIYINTKTIVNFDLSILPEQEFIRKRSSERLMALIFYIFTISILLYISFSGLILRYPGILYMSGSFAFFLSGSFFREGYSYEFIPSALSFISQVHFFALGLIFASLFARNFLQLKKLSPVLDTIMLGTIVYNGFVLLTYPTFTRLSGSMLILFVILAPALYFFCGFYAWRRGNKAARIYALSLLGFVPLVPFVIIGRLMTTSTPFLSFINQHAFKLFITTQILILSKGMLERINITHQEKIKAREETLALKEEYNQELELEVQERTRELSASLRETQALKQQSDGDYYLTSLLIDPLSRNKTSSSNVHMSFLIKQKKQFSFHKWDAELGGDLNAAHTLKIDGRHRTIFINADAMGKSMQGAGGALVLGSAFQSIIEQTKSTPSAFTKGPEAWLTTSFKAMDQLFQSFDGAMLVSMVMGVLEDDTGMLFWINAEHPQPVLYREDSVQFLGDESDNCPKLGDRTGKTFPRVSSFQLHPGDIFISGSDGRDDVKLPAQGEHSFIVNSDETIFLDIVLRNQANLDHIFRDIQSLGKIIDDVSLLRLEFLESKSGKQYEQ